MKPLKAFDIQFVGLKLGKHNYKFEIDYKFFEYFKYDDFNNVNVIVDTDNISGLMLDADLAIGAGGSTTWERCCLGLPTLLFVLSENQRKVLIEGDYQVCIDSELTDGSLTYGELLIPGRSKKEV